MRSSPRPTEASAGWRASILEHFTPEIAAATRLTIVSDPEELLTEEVILGELRARGFDLIPFEDHVAFRFEYESRYRQIWDREETTNLVVLLRSPSGDIDQLPYDLLEQAKRQERCLKFSVVNIFPNLSPNIVLELDRPDFDSLFAAQAQHGPKQHFGLDATRDFVLRHVFKVAPELITTPAQLLHALLQRHYRGLSIPKSFDLRLIHLLTESGLWKDWPLREIVPHRSAFLSFLNERWPDFVKQSIHGTEARQSTPTDAFRISGPASLPFGHADVRVYIDNLFQEGHLTPADDVDIKQVPEPWMRVGVAGSEGEDRTLRFGRLLARLEADLPNEDADRRTWIAYARTWAEWTALRWELADSASFTVPESCESLHDQIESRFSAWMHRNYASLHNLSSFARPAMVHHIPRHMSHSFVPTRAQFTRGDSRGRYALVVVDGLALDQWAVMRADTLRPLGDGVEFEEDGAFAWVPTLTAVSRQAILAGSPPWFFADSLRSTSKEERHWKRFWEDHGAKPDEIGYVREGKNRPDAELFNAALQKADDPKMRMLAVVVGKVDQTLHGITTGIGGLHSVVRNWASTGALGSLLAGLIERNFEITLTADHGNVQGRGIGKPQVGVLAEERGSRAYMFDDAQARKIAAGKLPTAIEWPQIGLPDHYLALLAPGRDAFTTVGAELIGHGGIAMEEVIVPFVQIRRRQP